LKGGYPTIDGKSFGSQLDDPGGMGRSGARRWYGICG